jgi:hypothetical protein
LRRSLGLAVLLWRHTRPIGLRFLLALGVLQHSETVVDSQWLVPFLFGVGGLITFSFI